MVIDNDLNVILNLSPTTYKGDKPINLDFFLERINRKQFNNISLFLGAVYEIIKDNGVNPDVLVIDWEFLLRNKLGDEVFSQEIVKFESFFERTLLTTHAFCPQNNKFYEMAKQEAELVDDLGLDMEAIKNELKGLMLFFSALYRYMRGETRQVVLGLLATSKTLSEWKDSHKKSMQEPKKRERKKSAIAKKKATTARLEKI